MTAKDRKIERKLAALRRRFAEELREKLQECASSSSNHATELLDMVSDGELDDFTARIAEADSVKIGQIEEALRMLREGRYGTCQRCDRKIPKRRLQAIPFAVLCVQCKEREEREMHMRPASNAVSKAESPVEFSLDEPREASGDLQAIYNEMETSGMY